MQADMDRLLSQKADLTHEPSISKDSCVPDVTVLDDIQISSKYTMTAIAEEFVLNGGKLLCFDEIHKYMEYYALHQEIPLYVKNFHELANRDQNMVHQG